MYQNWKSCDDNTRAPLIVCATWAFMYIIFYIFMKRSWLGHVFHLYIGPAILYILFVILNKNFKKCKNFLVATSPFYQGWETPRPPWYSINIGLQTMTVVLQANFLKGTGKPPSHRTLHSLSLFRSNIGD